MDPNTAKAPQSSRASNDTRGTSNEGPVIGKSATESLPTVSAVDLSPAIEVSETKIENTEVPHGNSGNRGMDTRMEDGDTRVEDGHKPAAHVEPVEELVEKTAQSSIAEDQKPAVENGESKIEYPENPGVTHGKSGTNDIAKAPQSSPAPQSCRALSDTRGASSEGPVIEKSAIEALSSKSAVDEKLAEDGVFL